MLDKAVAAVKADRDVALAMFNKGESGFRDRDLYPFCIRVTDGKNVAGPVYVRAGMDTRTLRDPSGKAYGQEVFAAAQKPEGQSQRSAHAAKAGHHRARGSEGDVRNEGKRSRLRGRLLQVERSVSFLKSLCTRPSGAGKSPGHARDGEGDVGGDRDGRRDGDRGRGDALPPRAPLRTSRGRGACQSSDGGNCWPHWAAWRRGRSRRAGRRACRPFC